MPNWPLIISAVTSENQGFLGVEAFARMRPGAALILLSRAASTISKSAIERRGAWQFQLAMR